MTNEIIKSNPFEITTFAEAEKVASMIAASSLCPLGFKGKPGDVFIAMQMGHEVGLSPMQAIQNIAVINGRPSVWGDAAIGIVRSHPHCKAIREWIEGSIEDKSAIAYCGVTRAGQPEEIRSFSYTQAETAGLAKKAGVWTQYPLRMLQMRARGFAIRDTFPDALRGLHIAEESQDIVDVTYEVISQVNKAKQLEGIPLSQSNTTDPEILQKHLDKIFAATDMDLLKIAYADALKATKGDKEGASEIAKAKNDRKDYLKQSAQQDTTVVDFFKEADEVKE
jgi:hypothetical protein